MMTAENCTELAELVRNLAEAMNEKKRIDDDPLQAPEQRVAAQERITQGMEAIRAHKASHQCELSAQTEAPTAA